MVHARQKCQSHPLKLYRVGCVSKIKQLVKLPDGVIRVEGEQKGILLNFDGAEPALIGEIQLTEDERGEYPLCSPRRLWFA